MKCPKSDSTNSQGCKKKKRFFKKNKKKKKKEENAFITTTIGVYNAKIFRTAVFMYFGKNFRGADTSMWQ